MAYYVIYDTFWGPIGLGGTQGIKNFPQQVGGNSVCGTGSRASLGDNVNSLREGHQLSDTAE